VDRPLREERLKEFECPGADGYAVITRNAYGCQVLNTERAMFVDIDLPEPAKPAGGASGWLKRLFGGRPDGPPPDPPETEALAKVERLARNDHHVGVRVYRTRAGLRLMMTHAPMDPKAQASLDLMASLEADPLYINLCRVQECFRARLTPKPWRCGYTACREPYPWRNDAAQRRFAKWEAGYLKASEKYATCILLKELGNRTVHRDLAPIVRIHDELTGVDSGLPLA
jgi:hypothetical protein